MPTAVILHHRIKKNFECEPILEVTEKIPESNCDVENLCEDIERSQGINLFDETQLSHHVERSILFKIIPVRLYGNNEIIVETFAMLDSGSTLTLIDSEVFDKLGVIGKVCELTLQWTKGIARNENATQTSINLSGSKGKKHFLKKVYSIANLDLPEQTVNANELKERYKHLRGLPLKSFMKAKPKILIGLEHSKFLCCENSHQGNENEPIASKTELGWIVFGKSAPSMKFGTLGLHMNSPAVRKVHDKDKMDDENLHILVKNYFTTENFGVMPPRRDLVSEENKRALEIMNRTLKKINGRYEMGLLWKRDNIVLPDSFPMAMKRLIILEKSLRKKPELLKWKNDHMKSLLAKGYARIATDEELNQEWPRVWYAPTFVTFNENKVPPKPRDVADVAAQVNGVSLNTNLLKGPDNLISLLTGLFRFREYAIAVNADVREMFHQIRIILEDQQCQRILWRDGDDSKKPLVYIMQAMMFGPTCSPACAQFVKNYHASLYLEKYPEAADGLIKSTYVDDYFNSHPTVEKAYEVITNAIEICADMGFDLVGVQSNSKELLQKLPEHNVKLSMVSLDASESESFVTKVLGMFWKALLDNFTYTFFENESTKKMLDTDHRPTKREVLSTLMKTFDPLGLLSHYLVQGKMILQEIWREGTDWDEEITQDLTEKWKEFVTELRNIGKIEIPRFYSPNMPEKKIIQLIIFVDASAEAFAATAYFRFEAENGLVHVAQVIAKAKVAPIKQLSIPQLELQAAILGIRLAATVKANHTLKIDKTKYLTDSKVVLAWINSKKYKFKPFVAVRIGEILENSTRNEWFHVPTSENVADDATRMNNAVFGDFSTRWFQGPEFLKQPEESWPIKRYSTENEDEDVHRATLLLIQPETTVERDVFDNIKARFKSKWTSMVRVVAFILRAAEKFRKISAENSGFVTPQEFRKAEEKLFQKIQQEAFPDEYHDLKNVKKVRQSSKIYCLSPFLGEDGVIRMSSRSQNAKISYAARNPAILPNKHELVDLMIQHHHERNQHMAEETTIADVRESAWIISTRIAVRRVVKNCQFCKIRKAKPVLPLMGQLPEARVDFGVKPFTYVGIDCFGPLNVKFGRGTAKRYGIIFTCLTYRAVHLELLFDMSLDQVMMAVRSLFARRGKSKTFYSDCGTNLVGCDNQLKKDVAESARAFGDQVARKYAIEWKFIPAYSPWMGGAWERLIQTIKRSIDFTLNGETPREDILKAALMEAEYQMNQRPLTHAPIDHEDAKPLTPNMVLIGEDNDEGVAPGDFDEKFKYSSFAYRRAYHLAQKYMHRWLTEYLPEITRRTKWHKNIKPIEVGDVVIMIEPNETKYAWHKGRVTKVYPGPDGVTRTADIIMADKTMKLKRSVGRLAVLDVKSVSLGE